MVGIIPKILFSASINPKKSTLCPKLSAKPLKKSYDNKIKRKGSQSKIKALAFLTSRLARSSTNTYLEGSIPIPCQIIIAVIATIYMTNREILNTLCFTLFTLPNFLKKYNVLKYELVYTECNEVRD